MTATRRKPAATCGVCGKDKPLTQLIDCDIVRPSVAGYLDREVKDWRHTGWICKADMEEFRRRAVEDMIAREKGELTALDKAVLDSLETHETVTEDVEERYAGALSFGDRLADQTANFAGSWTFIVSFVVVIVLWMTVNAAGVLARSFDPFPFILLNLGLSMIAAVQAPLIMMSQRRQEEKDRLRSKNDYRINLKAELEIRQIHEKIDHLLIRQWERLSRIQEAQLEILEELTARKRP